MEPKETPSCLILCLLVVFTQQLEILVTAPFTVSKAGHTLYVPKGTMAAYRM